MFHLDLLQQEQVSLLAPDTEAFLTVFGPLVQHCRHHQAGQPQVSAAVSVQTDGHEDQLGVSPSGQPPGLIQPLHLLADPGWPKEVISLSFIGLFLFPTLLLEKDLSMVDQFLKGETMTVAASTWCWCTVMVSPLRNWSATAGSFSRRRVGKRKRSRKERLTTFALPARVGKPVVR